MGALVARLNDSAPYPNRNAGGNAQQGTQKSLPQSQVYAKAHG